MQLLLWRDVEHSKHQKTLKISRMEVICLESRPRPAQELRLRLHRKRFRYFKQASLDLDVAAFLGHWSSLLGVRNKLHVHHTSLSSSTSIHLRGWRTQSLSSLQSLFLKLGSIFQCWNFNGSETYIDCNGISLLKIVIAALQSMCSHLLEICVLILPRLMLFLPDLTDFLVTVRSQFQIARSFPNPTTIHD